MGDKYIPVAKFGAAHGLKGFIRVIPFIDPSELLLEFSEFYVKTTEKTLCLKVETIKPHKKDNYLLKILELDEITDIENLTHHELLVERVSLPKLPKDRYYIGDLLGCSVIDTDHNYLGTIVDILQYSANDIYVIGENDKSFMLPAVKEFIKNIDMSNKEVLVALPEGIREI